MPKFGFFVVIGLLAAMAGAEAAPIAWYRMEGTSGNAVTAVANSISGTSAAPGSTATGATFKAFRRFEWVG